MAMISSEAADFLKLSVKELRRQAALRNVPLTHISAALEKADLVALILRAPPVLDQYGISGAHAGGKVWDANSVVAEESRPKRKKKKKRQSSSSSSSSSRSKRGKKKKRRKRGRRSTSPAARIATPLEASVLEAMSLRAEGGRPSALMTSSNTISGAPPMNTSQGTTVRAIMADVPDAPLDLRAPPPTRRGTEPTVAQAGMAAAAALGFDVLPKAHATALPPAPVGGSSSHLRPSQGSAAAALAGTGAFNALPSRICIEYLCKSSCQLGANCPESHILDPEEEMRVRSRFKEQECNYGAMCTRSSCLYRHPGEKQEEAILGDNPTQGVVLKPGPGGGMSMHLA